MSLVYVEAVIVNDDGSAVSLTFNPLDAGDRQTLRDFLIATARSANKPLSDEESLGRKLPGTDELTYELETVGVAAEDLARAYDVRIGSIARRLERAGRHDLARPLRKAEWIERKQRRHGTPE